MGVWGYRPYDSDDAQDWLGNIEVLIVRWIKKAIQRGTPNEVIAAAGLLVELDGPPINLCYEATREGLYHKMVTYLAKLRADDAWVKTWDRPEMIEVYIRLLILRLQAVSMSYTDFKVRASKLVKYKTRKRPKRAQAPKGRRFVRRKG